MYQFPKHYQPHIQNIPNEILFKYIFPKLNNRSLLNYQQTCKHSNTLALSYQINILKTTLLKRHIKSQKKLRPPPPSYTLPTNTPYPLSISYIILFFYAKSPQHYIKNYPLRLNALESQLSKLLPYQHPLNTQLYLYLTKYFFIPTLFKLLPSNNLKSRTLIASHTLTLLINSHLLSQYQSPQYSLQFNNLNKLIKLTASLLPQKSRLKYLSLHKKFLFPSHIHPFSHKTSSLILKTLNKKYSFPPSYHLLRLLKNLQDLLLFSSLFILNLTIYCLSPLTLFLYIFKPNINLLFNPKPNQHYSYQQIQNSTYYNSLAILILAYSLTFSIFITSILYNKHSPKYSTFHTQSITK